MQTTLFGPLEAKDRHSATVRGKPSRVSPSHTSRDQEESAEPEATLFGPVETKAQARKRAQRIVRLIGTIEEAPDILACYEGDITTLDYFIERGTNGTLSPNDHDGLRRFVGDLDEILTEDDCREMRDRADIWKPLPGGWLGNVPGLLYASALHLKEVAYLRQLQEDRRDEILAVLEGVETAKSELPKLKSICPIPAEIANRFGLTPMGDRLKSARQTPA